MRSTLALAMLLGTSAWRAATPTRQRCPAPRAALFQPRPVAVGEQWEGLIASMTDYGFFVRMGHEQHMGLVHIRTLSTERLPREDVRDWLVDNVGPIGSKVQVEVLSTEFRGTKRIALRLLDVVSRQNMEDLVFAPGPRRRQGGFEDEIAEDGEIM